MSEEIKHKLITARINAEARIAKAIEESVSEFKSSTGLLVKGVDIDYIQQDSVAGGREFRLQGVELRVTL